MQYSTEYNHPKATESKRAYAPNKTKVVAPFSTDLRKGTRSRGFPEKLPRVVSALSLRTDNRNSGPRGHKWLTKVSSTDASALVINPH